MLLKHSLMYLVARGVPGVVNFLAIALYTRLLDPAMYGQYTLLLTGVGLADALVFQWLRLGLLRYLPESGEERASFLATIRLLFLWIAGGSLLLTLAAWLLLPPGLAPLIGLALALLWVHGWFELNLELVRTQLSPTRYGFLAVGKAVLSLAFAILFIHAGLGAAGILLGLGLGMVLPYLLLSGAAQWRAASSAAFNRQLAGKLLQYGLPLTLTFALGFIVSSSDRFLLAALSGTDVAGLYAASYDLGQFTIGVILNVVNLASYPLIVRAMTQGGELAARRQLQSSALLLLSVGLPAAAGLAVLAPGVAAVVVGPEFQLAAVTVIPLVALAALLAGFRAYHVDVGFQLGNRTGKQAWVMLAAALVNIGLNLWWIPLYGLPGAVNATVVAYLVALVLSWLLVRRVFPVPAPPRDVWKTVAAAAVMVLVLRFFSTATGVLQLALQVLAGAGAYALVLVLLSPARAGRLFRLRSGL